ncbi:MAG: hypothetical protein U0350_42825 [Caldilineaceae bacterium]
MSIHSSLITHHSSLTISNQESHVTRTPHPTLKFARRLRPSLLFGTMVIAGFGVPLPIVLMLLTAGALAQQKLLALPNVIGVAIQAAIIGDHLGYAGALGWAALVYAVKPR